MKKFGKVKRQVLPFVNVGMEYSRTEIGGIALTQVNYADALKPLSLLSGEGSPSELNLDKALTPAGIARLRGGIGAVLFLCLTRWDLLCDVVLLQTQVKNATGQALKDCNAIIMHAKRWR